MLLKTHSQGLIIGLPRGCPRHHHKIHPALPIHLQAEAFSDQTLDAVSVHGIAYAFPRNGETQAGLAPIIGASQNRQIII